MDSGFGGDVLSGTAYVSLQETRGSAAVFQGPLCGSRKCHTDEM
jgi:hypothetical protein